jgi:hypothetical protein
VDARTIIDALPKLACGSRAYPGRLIWRTYLGERWEARIVQVGDRTLDIQYTNAANHRAKGCVARLRPASDWMAQEPD